MNTIQVRNSSLLSGHWYWGTIEEIFFFYSIHLVNMDLTRKVLSNRILLHWTLATQRWQLRETSFNPKESKRRHDRSERTHKRRRIWTRHLTNKEGVNLNKKGKNIIRTINKDGLELNGFFYTTSRLRPQNGTKCFLSFSHVCFPSCKRAHGSVNIETCEGVNYHKIK